jgi:hypothetical protein
MATYVVPQTLVFQDLSLVPAADRRPLNAFICGGHAQLVRYSEADEKESGLLGYYDNLAETCYAWPNREAGGVIDDAYTKVYIDDALLKYYDDFIGADDTIETVANEPNQIRSDATSFVANGTSYPRDAQFLDRDVKVGDIAKVRAVVGGTPYTLWSYVSGFVAEAVAAVVGSASADTDNAATQSAPSATSTQTAGAINSVDVDSIDQASYDGLEDGDINETYTVTVIEGSAGGDATTATLRVTSASGNDDVAEVTPAAFASPTIIGTRGLTVTFDDAGTADTSASADNDGVSDNNFIPGQTWQITCGQAFTEPTATSGGTYTGDVSANYIIEVTKGGLYADSPQITVTTDKGVDSSGPTVVSASGSAVAVGTKGITVAFNQTGLCKGDRYIVAATAEGEGAIQTIKLGHNLPVAVQNNGATEVDLTLYIKADIEVPENSATPGVTNWTQSDTELCLADAITAFDPSWTDSGVVQALPVESESTKSYGKVYVEYRAWLPTLCAEVNSMYDLSEIDNISGSLHPDNPLKWGVFKALSNSNGTAVSYMSVCDPTVSSNWTTVITRIDGRSDVYGIVPLTRDKTVLDLFEAHVNSQSSAEFGRWRVLWVNINQVSELAIVDSSSSSDGEEVLATLADDPLTSGTQYTYLQVPAGNGFFVTNGVRAGDIVRFLYTTDGFGNATYTEFVVDAVVNEDTIRLQDGHAAAVNIAQKIEIWRNLTASEQADEISKTAGYSSRRVRAVWPDTVGSGGITFEGFHLCAALAGLSSGVVPQQGLTNLAISGFDDISRTTDLFNRSQLNEMAGNGVWIVTQDLNSGDVYSRHAVTTASYDNINEREEMITRNLDSISFFFLDTFSPYIGVSNITPDTLKILRAEANSAIQTLRSRYYTQRTGAQLIDGELTRLTQHTTLKDRVVSKVTLNLPYALNNIEQYIII